MISRHWRGLAKKGCADTYVEHLRTETFPALRALAGFEGASPSFLVTLALLACVCLAGPAAAQQTEEAAAIAAAQAAADAFRDGNISALEELLAPDITVVDTGGRVATRDNILDAIRSGALRYEVFLNRDTKARIYGDSAIVVGITAVKGKFVDQPFSLDVRFTDVLVRDKGKWKLVATHATRIPGQ